MNFKPIRVEVEKNVATLSVWPMNQGIRQQFTQNPFVVMRDRSPKQTVRQFIKLAPIRHIPQNRLDKFKRIQ